MNTCSLFFIFIPVVQLFLGKCENGLANNRCMVYLELLLFLAFGVPE